MNAPLYQVRQWTPQDHAMINTWRRVHGTSQIPEALIPPTNVIVEIDGDPVCFAALYLSPTRDGAGNIGLIEFLTTCPGQTLNQSTAHIKHAIEALCYTMAHAGGGLMNVYVGRAGSRIARANGFETSEGVLWCNSRMVEAIIKPED